LLSICGLLKAGPRKILSFKPVRSTKKFADPWTRVRDVPCVCCWFIYLPFLSFTFHWISI